MSNALASMTGYARAHGGVPGVAFSIEIKSVNARGLDIRMRATPGYDELEPEVRRRIRKALTRGSLTENLNIDRDGEGGRVTVNHQALAAVLAAIKEIGAVAPSPPTPDGILALKGVLDRPPLLPALLVSLAARHPGLFPLLAPPAPAPLRPAPPIPARGFVRLQ